MKVVLDTNVVVSGLLSPYGPCADILRWVADGSLRLAYDGRIIEEYRTVLLRPKFGFETNLIECLVDNIQQEGSLVTTQPLKQRLPDEDDEPFLEATLAGEVDFLVTGNKKHFPQKLRSGAKVVAPQEFLNCYRKWIG